MRRTRRTRARGHWALVGVPLVLTIMSIAAGSALAEVRTPTKGVIPPEANVDGAINWSLIPEYIVALGRDGNPVGYVSRELTFGLVPPALDEVGRPVARAIPVYGEDLVTVVGHMVPDRGFVPLGADYDAIQRLEASVAPIP